MTRACRTSRAHHTEHRDIVVPSGISPRASGLSLNTALPRAGLIDDLSVLVAPYLVGHGGTLLDGPPRSATELDLLSAEPQAEGHVWLRYAVTRR